MEVHNLPVVSCVLVFVCFEKRGVNCFFSSSVSLLLSFCFADPSCETNPCATEDADVCCASALRCTTITESSSPTLAQVCGDTSAGFLGTLRGDSNSKKYI